MVKHSRFIHLIMVAGLSSILAPAFAEPIKIVAFGGSNTFGKNLSRSAAYPGQLEELLRSKGHDVVVINEGTNGQTTSDELGRLKAAIPPDTKIVIFQPGGNDRSKSVARSDSKKNVEEIVGQLLAKNIQVIFSGNSEKQRWVVALGVVTIGELNSLAPGERQPDGQHLTKEGYKVVAETLVPIVEDMLLKLPAK